MSLKIIQPITKPLKEFETPEQFNLFYSQNKDVLDKQTTHKLNKQYHIKGYWITKIKGEICLKLDNKIKNVENGIPETKETRNIEGCASGADRDGQVRSTREAIPDPLRSLRDDIQKLKVDVEELKNKMNEIIKVVNSLV